MKMKASSTGQLQPIRHIPRRTCVSCREVKPKRELIRVVHTGGGAVEVDPSGKKPGRGAYLCYSADCWQKGLKKARLERALRGTIGDSNWAELLEVGKTLCYDDMGNTSSQAAE